MAQLPNGGFENGDLSGGWSTGGAGAVEVLQATNFSPLVDLAEGNYAALITTGPDNNGGPGGDFDANGTADYNSSSLSLAFTTTDDDTPLTFDWLILTRETDQAIIYDDFFTVELDGVAILQMSVFQLVTGVCPYRDTEPYDGIRYDVSSSGALDGSRFDSGRLDWRRFGATVATAGDHTLRFFIADQGDTNFDTGLLIDNVRAPSDSYLQLTRSEGSSLEVKDGGLVFRFHENRGIALSDDGSLAVFISSADYAGLNPNHQYQLFAWEDPGGYEQLTAMTGGDIGRPAVTANGRWLAFSANAVPSQDPSACAGCSNPDGNNEIFRLDRASGTFTQITYSSGCQNQNPSIAGNTNGGQIAFTTTCDVVDDQGPVSIGNVDGNREVVAWDSGTFELDQPTSGCTSASPRISRDAGGRYVAFVSSCDLTGSNGDGNGEIFQWDRTSNSYTQVTDSTAPTANDAPSTNGDGRYVALLSDADYAGTNGDGNLEVFRWDRTIDSFTQMTNTTPLDPSFLLHISTDMDVTGRWIATERLNIFASPPSSIVFVDGDTLTAPTLAFDGQLPVIGVSEGSPVLAFESSGDLIGLNSDENREVWRGLTLYEEGSVITPGQECSTPNIAIPDNNASGVTDTLTVSDSGAITDLDVIVRITHTYVGDLVVTLTHVDTGTSVILIDRPGRPGSTWGCRKNNIDATLDDDAFDPVEDECGSNNCAICGTFSPNNPLSAFNGEDVGGTWQLQVSDFANGDTGVLTEWCVVYE